MSDFIFGAAFGLVAYWLIARNEQKRHEEEVDILLETIDEALNARDEYRRKYDESVAREAVKLSQIGNVDQEWADWCARMDVERIWEAGDTDE